MSKAQQVYDNVYEECINKLGKTPQRAEYVAKIAYELAIETLVKQAEAEKKHKEMNDAFV